MSTSNMYPLSLHDALPILHVLQAGSGGQKSAVEMDRQQSFPVGEGKVHDRFYDLDPGIADEHIDAAVLDRKSTRLNSSHANISYAVFCLKKKKKQMMPSRL